jgi:uncharacterized GH25 family protein
MRRLALVVAALLVSSTSARSHDTWLLCSSATSSPGRTVTFAFTSGMKFPDPESAPAPDRLAATGFRLGDRTRRLEVDGSRGGALVLRVPGAREGVAVAWAATRPRAIELKPDQVREYLEEVGVLETVGRQWEERGRRPWRESYVKLAKTCLRVGRPRGDGSWSARVGLALELVPETDPTQLAPGDTLRLRLVRDDRPLPEAAVAALAAGGAAVLRRTDAEGRVAFSLDKAGPWLFRVTVIEPATLPDADWQSQFSTLTLHVAPK